MFDARGKILVNCGIVCKVILATHSVYTRMYTHLIVSGLLLSSGDVGSFYLLKGMFSPQCRFKIMEILSFLF